MCYFDFLYDTQTVYDDEKILGSSVPNGGSGYGLVFEHDGLYYLTGVASIKEQSSSVVLFTEIKSSIQWLCDMFMRDSNTKSNSYYYYILFIRLSFISFLLLQILC